MKNRQDGAKDSDTKINPIRSIPFQKQHLGFPFDVIKIILCHSSRSQRISSSFESCCVVNRRKRAAHSSTILNCQGEDQLDEIVSMISRYGRRAGCDVFILSSKRLDFNSCCFYQDKRTLPAEAEQADHELMSRQCLA
jgi:hypothetical protein